MLDPTPVTRPPTGSETSRSGVPPAGATLEFPRTKLEAPPRLKPEIERSDLLADLEAARDLDVILLTAGAGFGKTTLLGQHAGRSTRPCAWLTLDARDNDPVLLLACVARALGEATDLDTGIIAEITTAGASVEGRLVPLLSARIASIEQPFLFVIDDVQELVDRRCIDALDELVAALPPGSQAIISGRVQSSRRIPALRSRGALLEIGPESLRMSREETAGVVAGLGAEFSEDELGDLVDRTEGWPVGIYLGTLAFSAGGAIASASDAFRGDSRFIADFIRTEILATLPPDQFSFLVETSVLDRICGGLCDDVLESTGSASMIASLERSGLFIVPLDQLGEWFRYERVFREALRAELDRSAPGRVGELLRRACDWSSDHGEVDDAIAYAQAAGDRRRMGHLVLAHAQTEYRRGKAVTVDGWLDWLDAEGELDPMIAVMGAWYSTLRGGTDRADRWRDIAVAAEADAAAEHGGRIDGWLGLISVARAERSLGELSAAAEATVETFARSGPWWSTAAFMLALVRILEGRTAEADDLLSVIGESAESTGAANAGSLALAERAVLAAARDDWADVEAFVEQGEGFVRRSRTEGYPPNALLYGVGARLAVRRGEHELASGLLTQAQVLRPNLTRAFRPVAVQTRLELGSAYVALADAAGARTLLSEVGALMRPMPEPGVLAEQAEELRRRLDKMHTTAPGVSTLTGAELRLLPLLPTHLSFPEIGERLFVSRHTVKSQAIAIYRKLDVTSRAEAVERARDLGLL